MRKENVMTSKAALFVSVVWIIGLFTGAYCASGQEANEPNSTIADSIITNVELARYNEQYSSVLIKPARIGRDAGIAVIFEGTEDLHYYARAETATAPGF